VIESLDLAVVLPTQPIEPRIKDVQTAKRMEFILKNNGLFVEIIVSGLFIFWVLDRRGRFYI